MYLYLMQGKRSFSKQRNVPCYRQKFFRRKFLPLRWQFVIIYFNHDIK